MRGCATLYFPGHADGALASRHIPHVSHRANAHGGDDGLVELLAHFYGPLHFLYVVKELHSMKELQRGPSSQSHSFATSFLNSATKQESLRRQLTKPFN